MENLKSPVNTREIELVFKNRHTHTQTYAVTHLDQTIFKTKPNKL